ncbi:MAG TPA: MBL fold metallo-hydrolase [Desulfobacterales bacterium]|nr:MBL fold metallo-hydrolase [Desulfobacterales bacterium]
MPLSSYKAEDLFDWVNHADSRFVLLDVRNNEEFGRFKVEGPHQPQMINVPYVEFVEKEEESTARVPPSKPIRIVCAKEGSAKFVGEILVNHGWEDVAFLQGGIKTWGNMLAPRLVAEKDGYRLFQFIRPGKAACSYGLLFKDEMAVFDPSRNVDFYERFASENGCRIVRTYETHLQADYISGSQLLSQKAGAAIVGHENDFQQAVFSYLRVKDGDVSRLPSGGPEILAVHMPGHTPGSTSYLIDRSYLISGDAIFILSIGRPDLGGKAVEWAKLLFHTIKTQIASLSDTIVVLPGHYMDWSEMNAKGIFAESLGGIRKRNADIYGIADEKSFIRFIQDNMRAQPEVYGKIRQVNAGLALVDADEQEVMDLGKNECAASMQRA